MAGRKRAVKDEAAAEQDGLPRAPEPDDPEARRLLEAGSYRDYLRRRIAVRFEQVASAFLEAAETGSAVHMRMIVALMEQADGESAGEGGDGAMGAAERAEQEWEELNRRGAVPNL